MEIGSRPDLDIPSILIPIVDRRDSSSSLDNTWLSYDNSTLTRQLRCCDRSTIVCSTEREIEREEREERFDRIIAEIPFERSKETRRCVFDSWRRWMATDKGIEPTIEPINGNYPGHARNDVVVMVSFLSADRGSARDCYVKRRIPFSDLVCATPLDHSRDPWPSFGSYRSRPCRCSCLIIPFNRSETRDTTFFFQPHNKQTILIFEGKDRPIDRFNSVSNYVA